jgi:hypothetical protein
VPNTKQADGEIHEDQLLNFLVNSLDEEVALTLAENAELDAEDIYEVLVGACADGTSISTLCENSEDAPHENSVLYHLRTKFDLETLEQVGNTLLQKDVLDVLPEQVEVVADLHLRPTMATKTTRTVSITPKRSVEPPRSTPTPHSTRV